MVKVVLFVFFALTSLQVTHSKTISIAVENVVVGPALLDYIQRAKNKCMKQSCNNILLMISTPGGSLQSTRIIVSEILNSPIPFLCLIYPSGGHAGSAGAIIMQACHLSGAMTATNIGAATPVTQQGKDINKDLRKKIINDTKSWLKSLTELRGRNYEFGQKIITEAESVSAEDAVKMKAIDFLATSPDSFLKWADGQEIYLNKNEKVKIDIGAVVEFPQDLRFKVMEIVMDPQVAYMMFMGSIGLLYFEITHPGLMVPGIVGGVGLIVSLISLHKLDVQLGGLLLMLLGVVLMIAEAFVASFGALGIGGVVSFMFGSLLLFDKSQVGFGLSPQLIFTTTTILGLIMMMIAYLAYSTKRLKLRKDFDSVVGKDAVVVEVGEGGRKGMIEVNGETWSFISKTDVQLNQQVQVIDNKGFTLIVSGNEE